MSSSRDQSQYGRKRSNTAQSSFRSVPVTPPLKVGDSKVLNAWVHDVKDSPQVVFNQSWWPGVSEGDVLRVCCDPEQPDASFLFIVPKDEGCPKPQLQVRQTCARPLSKSHQEPDIYSEAHSGGLWIAEPY